MDVGGFDVLFGKAEGGQHVEVEVGKLFVVKAEGFLAEGLAKRKLVEGELDVKGAFQAFIDRLDCLIGKALGLQRARIDGRGLVEVAVADCISLDLTDLGFGVTECAQGLGHGRLMILK